MNDRKIYTGCSSYNTSSWKTLFYPEDIARKNWFTFYSKQFNTYEFNGSFYRFPETENLLNWNEKVPDDFQFSVKIPKFITHIKKLKDCEKEISDFYEVVKQGFQTKLGCVLWQFPPSFDFSEEKLKNLVSCMDSKFKNTVEFRNESWWRQEVFDELQTNNITFCNISYPKLPTEFIQTTPIGYFRFHGTPKIFYSEYTENEIKEFYTAIMKLNFKEIYIYFNNTATTAAIINAMQLRELIQ